MKFAEKLRVLRGKAGLSEAKLAEASGVSFGALHMYGLGLRKPSFDNVVKIARALGVTCEAFADCEDVGQDEPESPAKVTKEKEPAKEKASGKGKSKGK